MKILLWVCVLLAPRSNAKRSWKRLCFAAQKAFRVLLGWDGRRNNGCVIVTLGTVLGSKCIVVVVDVDVAVDVDLVVDADVDVDDDVDTDVDVDDDVVVDVDGILRSRQSLLSTIISRIISKRILGFVMRSSFC